MSAAELEAACAMCGAEAELAGGTGDDRDRCLMCAWKSAASAQCEATAVCSVIRQAAREALNGFANPADVREAVEEAVEEHAAWHPPYNAFVPTCEAMGNRQDELWARMEAQVTRNAEVGEAVALLEEIAEDRTAACCSDIRVDILDRLDAWIARRRGEALATTTEAPR